MTSYSYSPLGKNEIRLAYLQPTTSDPKDVGVSNEITIEIKAVKLGECSYSALSYVWGDTNRTEDLTIQSPNSQSTLKITENLQIALRQLRNSQTKVLWIDAVCINEDDFEECSEQVTRMSDIYSQASDVIIWLGEADYDSDKAMKFIPEISVRDLDRLAGSYATGESWRALASLMRRPWFGRRWIIQELAFAQKAEIHCGSMVVTWTQFAEAATLFESKIDDINRLFRELHKSEDSSNKFKDLIKYAVPFVVFTGALAVALFTRGGVKPKWIAPAAISHLDASFDNEIREKYNWNYEFPIGQIRGVGAHSLLTTLDRIICKRSDKHTLDRLCTTEALLSYLPTFQASVPSDTIFSVASLSNDYGDMTPDYGSSANFGFKELIKRTVSTTGSLNIICRPWAPNTPNAPSWFPHLSKYPFSLNSREIFTRSGADCLVGHPGHSPYRASGTVRASVTFTGDDKQYVLEAKGFQLDGYYNFLEPAKDGVIPSSWVHAGGRSLMSPSTENEALKEIFWRTLIGDRDEEGASPPSWMRHACEEFYKDKECASLDTTALLAETSDKSGAVTGKMKAFLRRVQAVTWNRRLFRTDEQSFGLLPEETRWGDHLCILFGCDVPVLLRKHEDGLWEFIGEAYVHGIMNGEAMECPYEEEVFCLK